MSGLDSRLSKGITTHAAFGAGLCLAHSLWTRGFRRTLLFGMLGHAMPVLGEYSAVNVVKILRHHVEPQVEGIPLAIVLGWYNVGYGTFAMVKSILNRIQLDKADRSRYLGIGTALVSRTGRPEGRGYAQGDADRKCLRSGSEAGRAGVGGKGAAGVRGHRRESR